MSLLIIEDEELSYKKQPILDGIDWTKPTKFYVVTDPKEIKLVQELMYHKKKLHHTHQGTQPIHQ